ncbi:UDP-2-acetamido-2-deoxy-3-oxo-D-glucuronate aminotransferase [Holospora obtusa F1]|uniref:UDP-2-acetamido-2-deoxy-3-oxo-D-glucuronate aminotransferase n=1 Tax=Holospora obtusa F1 TaxID=1399147 RepID=W6TUV5_HOLOB|nr:DegT/DnrJ/EryC1/StrS aminotransferase family protein [Holospora obtusa]ETZ07542.1 UDP-2-acetamido-2-deoxy-3-oxo-D-glucuronate aminotransferase [Holospora obtusa F1]
MTSPKKQIESHSLMPFIDLKAQLARLRSNIESAIKRVLDHGTFIMGPEVYTLEEQLKTFCEVKHAIACSNGTDALNLGLMAYQVGPGDAVFVPSFTFAATAEVVVWRGAVPIFVDVLESSYNMDPDSLEQGIRYAKSLGLAPKGIIPVDLFGQPADYDTIQSIAHKNCLWIIADSAQSFGATYKTKKVGNIGNIATTSFFPAKPLGCYGDGGAVFTNDDDLAVLIQSLRIHGQGKEKYDNVRIGINGRLDTIQAAILIEKLKVFPDELIVRQEIADTYFRGLQGILKTPFLQKDVTSSWAQYTVCLPETVCRKKLMEKLQSVGIPTVVYYEKPLHLQTAYRQYPTATGKGLPQCEKLSHVVLSLPISGYMHEAERIICALRKFI